MPNVEQSDYWDGAGGEHWVAEQVRYDKINAEFGSRVVAALGPTPGDRVLGVGCGNGALSLAIAPLVAPAGFVLGLDNASPTPPRFRPTAGRDSGCPSCDRSLTPTAATSTPPQEKAAAPSVHVRLPAGPPIPS